MRPADVERELLRLHLAGSLVELSLPCATTRERMVA